MITIAWVMVAGTIASMSIAVMLMLEGEVASGRAKEKQEQASREEQD